MANETQAENGTAPRGRTRTASPSDRGSDDGSGQGVTEAAAIHDATPRGTLPTRTAPDGGTEADLWAGRTNWKYFAGRLALWMVANIAVGIAIAKISSHVEWLTSARATLAIAGLVFASGLIVGGGILLRILGARYRLTDERLFIHRGILSQTADQLELIRVDDVRTHKTFLGRLLGIGTVIILTTDATDREVRIEGRRAPDTLAENVRSCMRKLRRKSLFVETL